MYSVSTLGTLGNNTFRSKDTSISSSFLFLVHVFLFLDLTCQFFHKPLTVNLLIWLFVWLRCLFCWLLGKVNSKDFVIIGLHCRKGTILMASEIYYFFSYNVKIIFLRFRGKWNCLFVCLPSAHTFLKNGYAHQPGKARVDSPICIHWIPLFDAELKGGEGLPIYVKDGCKFFYRIKPCWVLNGRFQWRKF